jgi:hypothetical protein
MHTNFDDLDEIINIQSKCISDPYMLGLYNGLVTAKAILTGTDSVLKHTADIKPIPDVKVTTNDQQKEATV